MRTYQLAFRAPAKPKVKVSIQLPPSWVAGTDDYGSPKFSVPGLKAPSLGLFLAPTDDGEPTARVEQAFKAQYEADADVSREQKTDGRLWANHTYGAINHARMFVPVPGGVAMGVAMLRDATEAQLAEVKATFETIQVVAQ
jgi:hypothetical protein